MNRFIDSRKCQMPLVNTISALLWVNSLPLCIKTHTGNSIFYPKQQEIPKKIRRSAGFFDDNKGGILIKGRHSYQGDAFLSGILLIVH